MAISDTAMPADELADLGGVPMVVRVAQRARLSAARRCVVAADSIAIIEACHDDAGIKWPEAVAPFKAVILNLKQGAEDVDAACMTLYRELEAKGVEVLYDDTDQRAGAKFAAADLIGIPWQILVGPKGLAEGKLEIKRRSDGSRENLSPAEVVMKITGKHG